VGIQDRVAQVGITSEKAVVVGAARSVRMAGLELVSRDVSGSWSTIGTLVGHFLWWCDVEDT
jgi:hypothetical protein